MLKISDSSEVERIPCASRAGRRYTYEKRKSNQLPAKREVEKYAKAGPNAQSFRLVDKKCEVI